MISILFFLSSHYRTTTTSKGKDESKLNYIYRISPNVLLSYSATISIPADEVREGREVGFFVSLSKVGR
jgi:hypothetical protein